MANIMLLYKPQCHKLKCDMVYTFVHEYIKHLFYTFIVASFVNIKIIIGEFKLV